MKEVSGYYDGNSVQLLEAVTVFSAPVTGKNSCLLIIFLQMLNCVACGNGQFRLQ